MIYQVVSVTIKPGKMEEARQLALDYVAHVLENNPSAKLEVLSNISGPSNQLQLTARYDSLSDFEATREKFATDSKGKELIAKLSDLFESGAETNLYRVES